MSDQPHHVFLDDTDETFALINVRLDDIDKVIIGAPWATLPNTQVYGDFTMMIHLLNGAVILVFRLVAEKLLNDGILHRLRIPIEFMAIGH